MKKEKTSLSSLLSSANSRKIALLCAAVLLILLNGLAIVREFSYVMVIATIALVGAYIVIFHADLAMFLMAFSTPLSIIIDNKDFHFGLSLPSEILMITLTLLLFVRILYDIKPRPEVLKHPISIVIFAYLSWMLITCFTSEIPLVSIKYFASKVWFITACYWMVIRLIDNDSRNVVRFFGCYALGLAIVVSITSVKHALSGFNENYAHWVMSPFYNDHTAYGAALAFMIPVTVGFLFLDSVKGWQKLFFSVVSVILLIGFYLSFSRAAWISLVAAIGVLIILKLRIKPSWLITAGVIFGALFFLYSDEILYKMSRNSQDSSGNLVEHLQSISNISTDASNMERINRWTSAFGMIEERPVFGWGPGTYQFVYAPFQQARFRTIISTDFGDGGNAHSEYINPCAESGIPGMITVFALLIVVIYCGIKTYVYSENRRDRLLALIMTLSLITYFTHGIFNNFLDTDKLSILFWSAFAVIAVCDMRRRGVLKND